MPQPPRRRFPTDAPTAAPLTRGAVIRSQRTATLYTIDGGDIAENTTGRAVAPGQVVTVRWNATGSVWQIVAAGPASEAHCTIDFLKAWEFDATGAHQGGISVHPGGRWIATAEGSVLKILDWAAESVADTLDITDAVLDVDFSPDGLWIACATGTSPYIAVLPFDPATGEIGTQISDPATAGGAAGTQVAWHPHMLAVMTDCNSATTPLSAWKFSGGALGNKYTFATGTVAGWGTNGPIPFVENLFVSEALITPNAAITAQKIGFALSPFGDTVVMTMRDPDGRRFMRAMQFNPYATTPQFMGAADSQQAWYNDYGFVPHYPSISHDGTVVAWQTENGRNYTSTGFGAELFLQELGLPHGEWGPVRAMPKFTPDMRQQSAEIGDMGSRRSVWRPNVSKMQVGIYVQPDQQASGAESRFVVATVEGARFVDHCEFRPADAMDNWFLRDLSPLEPQCAWHPDGSKVFLLTSSGHGPDYTPQIVVLSVEGE